MPPLLALPGHSAVLNGGGGSGGLASGPVFEAGPPRKIGYVGFAPAFATAHRPRLKAQADPNRPGRATLKAVGRQPQSCWPDVVLSRLRYGLLTGPTKIGHTIK